MDPNWGPAFNMFWIFPLLCLVFMAVMMLTMVRRGGGCIPMGRRDMSPNGGHETPRQILDRRLASGQINREQYDVMRRDIEAAGDDR